MNLKEEILKEHSKNQTLVIANYIGSNQQTFDELIHLLLHDEVLVAQRAAWVLRYSVEMYPFLIKKHLSSLINHLDKPDLHDSVKRNTLCLLRYVKIPDKLLGKIVDLCFRYLKNETEPIAVRAYSLNMLSEICAAYPELNHELKMVCNDLNSEDSPALKACIRNALKKLRN